LNQDQPRLEWKRYWRVSLLDSNDVAVPMFRQTSKECAPRQRSRGSQTFRNVVVIGAGGVGVVVGSALARGTWKVTMVDVNLAKVEAGRRDGAKVNGISQRNVEFIAFEQWKPRDDAVVVLCTKTYDNPAVLSRISYRHLLIPIQNGFDPELNSSSHPFEGIASFVSKCEPNCPSATVTRKGTLYLGGRRSLTSRERRVLEDLAAGLRAGGWKRVSIVDFILPYKSTKLLFNAAISPLAAAAGIDNETLLADPLAQRIFFALLRENFAILRRNRRRLARIGLFHPAVVDRILRIPILAQTLALLFRPGLRGTYCSMAIDMGTGRTEIAAYNGYLKSLAQGMACPINTAVLELVNRMSEEKRSPSREILWELLHTIGL
jgi:2-dehydropantoate 2-reductase